MATQVRLYNLLDLAILVVSLDSIRDKRDDLRKIKYGPPVETTARDVNDGVAVTTKDYRPTAIDLNGSESNLKFTCS